MKKHFYSYLIEIDTLIVELDKLDLDQDHKHELAKLVDSNLHHTILDAILAELSDQEKQVFLRHLRDDNQSKIWEHLNDKVDNIEEKIKKAAEQVKSELHQDIEEVGRRV